MSLKYHQKRRFIIVSISTATTATIITIEAIVTATVVIMVITVEAMTAIATITTIAKIFEHRLYLLIVVFKVQPGELVVNLAVIVTATISRFASIITIKLTVGSTFSAKAVKKKKVKYLADVKESSLTASAVNAKYSKVNLTSEILSIATAMARYLAQSFRHERKLLH